MPPVDEVGLLVDGGENLEDEPALADAGDTDERHELRLPLLPDAGERVEEEVELSPAPDELGRAVLSDVDAEPRARRERFPRRDGFRLALRVHRGCLAVVDRMACRPPGRLADEDAARRRRRLEARRRIHHVAGRDAFPCPDVGVQVDECLAGIDADSQLELERRIRLVQLPDRLVDRDCAANRPLGVVLVSGGDPEEADNGVPDELLHGAAEPLDLRADLFVVRREARTHVFGVEPLGRGRRADEVGEENADHLSLLPGCHGDRQRGAALRAELRRLGILRATARARGHATSVDPSRQGSVPGLS